jgi:CRP-like cAMP-binding protein
VPHRNNELLRRLEPSILERITPSLSLLRLEQSEVLAATHEPVHRVYFPHSGIISCVVELPGGGAIETGMIGKDGQWGACQAMDDRISLNHVVIQAAGEASVIEAGKLKTLALELAPFRSLLLSYDQFFTAHVQQTAACNAVHDIQPRLCKWLLRMHDLVGTELSLTQEFLAEMMGVRRTSVTQVAATLQKAGLINYKRGHITIVDLQGIQDAACDCHGELQSHYELLFGKEQ